MKEDTYVLAYKEGKDWTPLVKGTKRACLDVYNQRYSDAWKEGFVLRLFKFTVLAFLLLCSCVSESPGMEDAPAQKPAWERIYEACGERPQHWAGEDPQTWIKAADIWMGCAIWVE